MNRTRGYRRPEALRRVERHPTRLGTTSTVYPSGRSQPLSGLLSPEEIAAIKRTYAAGNRNQLLIGLRDRERLLTLMLPALAGSDARMRLVQTNAERLRKIGADGFIHVRPVHVRRDGIGDQPRIVVHDLIGCTERLAVGTLDPHAPLSPIKSRDRVALVVLEAVCGTRTS